MPAAAPAAAARPADPPRFITILAALSSDRGEATADLVNEGNDISFGDGSVASQRCYVLSNNVRYDVEQRLDRGARASAASDVASLQARLDATRLELENLRQDSQEFANNGVTPLGGKWATAAIAQMLTTMTTTATSANQTIATINADVAQGYRQYRSAWQRWGCPVSKLLQGPPPQVPKVTVKKLPAPGDP